ncbi:MAG: hypothetical protein WC557_04970 [Ignavibacteriaceae bacterium]
MELIPIIKLALVIFATVVFFIILISYMIYKAKEKLQTQTVSRNYKKENLGKRQPVLVRNESAFIKNNYSDHANKEQIYFVPKRQMKPVPVFPQQSKRPRERFKVVNEQQLNYKIYETRSDKPRAFYHPNDQSVKSFALHAPSGNILDSYSFSNEPLRKLA